MNLRIARKYTKYRPKPPRRKSLARHMQSHQRAEKILLRHSAAFREIWKGRMNWLLKEIFRCRECTECGEPIDDRTIIPEMCDDCYAKIPVEPVTQEDIDRIIARLKATIPGFPSVS